MKACVILLSLVILGGLTVAAQQPAVSWQAHAPANEPFSAMFPCIPQITNEDIKTKIGTVKHHSHACTSGPRYFAVAFSDFPVVGAENTVLDNYRDGIISGSKSKIDSESPIKLGSYAGRSFITKGKVDDLDVVYKWRLYLVGKRMYGIAVGAAASNADSPDVETFLSSFTLKQK